MVMMNVVRLQVPSWQRGPLYSKVKHRAQGRNPQGALRGHNMMTMSQADLVDSGTQFQEKAWGTRSMVLITLGHRGGHMY